MLTLAQVAHRLAVNPMTIRRLMRQGHISGYQLPGGFWRFDPKEIETFIANLRISNRDGNNEAAE